MLCLTLFYYGRTHKYPTDLSALNFRERHHQVALTLRKRPLFAPPCPQHDRGAAIPSLWRNSTTHASPNIWWHKCISNFIQRTSTRETLKHRWCSHHCSIRKSYLCQSCLNMFETWIGQTNLCFCSSFRLEMNHPSTVYACWLEGNDWTLLETLDSHRRATYHSWGCVYPVRYPGQHDGRFINKCEVSWRFLAGG